MSSKWFLKKSNPFLLLYFIFLLVGIFVIGSTQKSELHLFFNSFHSPFFDGLFKYLTHVGDGLFLTAVAIFLLFIKFRHSFILALSGILTGIITQGLKHFVFDEMVRPGLVFKGQDILPLVPGVELNHHFAFPSGHTSSAFCMFLVLSLISGNKILNIIFFFLALLTGFSRIYLSQHFFEDVYAGSIIGVFSVMIIYLLIYRYTEKSKAPWLHKSLIKF